MVYQTEIALPPEYADILEKCKSAVANKLMLHADEINAIKVTRRSIDARRGAPLIRMRLKVYTEDSEPHSNTIKYPYQQVSNKKPVVIVGAGPAGLFAALKLLENGLKPVILERGKSVKDRKHDIAKLTREHVVNPDSNWCFGEGGAGTYSDGKLYTRSNKRGNITEILEKFVEHGANSDILIDAHAHIGTDKLPIIVANIRKTIEDCGGEYHFSTKVVDFVTKGDKVVGVIDQNGDRYEGVAVILATGHSAHDIYELLEQKKWDIQAKPFALGVRVEHPQNLINEIQYHSKNYSPLLPAASYSLVTQVEGRGVFSFCMCPGGHIVPASTIQDRVVVNGMSNSQRNSPYANSGIVVQINLEDLAEYQQYGALAGLRFQQDVEQNMWVAGGQTQAAPAQRLADFVSSKLSNSLNKCSYIPGTTSAPLHELLPNIVSQSLQQAFKTWGGKMKGFLTNEANILAVESRTSSPVRIPRNVDTLEHTQWKGLYPCGEGAGYAGGITSSAIDGSKCAEMIVSTSYNA